MMKAKVVGIESGSEHADGRRRLRLKFLDGDSQNFRDTAVVSERAIGIVGLKLDDVIEVAFACDQATIRAAREAAKQASAQAVNK